MYKSLTHGRRNRGSGGQCPPPPLVGPAGTGGTGGGPMKMIFASAADSLYSVLYK